jgi:hypothetical protein
MHDKFFLMMSFVDHDKEIKFMFLPKLELLSVILFKIIDNEVISVLFTI